MSTQKHELETYGKSLVGKMAQSRLLKTLGADGKARIAPPSKITGYEIVTQFCRPALMVILDGESIHEELIINIH
jgi:hypothetical protein